MVRDFKFFSGNDDSVEVVESYDGASWIYGEVLHLDQYRYDIIIDNHYGIRSFLNNFPPNVTVTIISITGPDGRIHNVNNDDVGWGFDILNDLIRVEWVRFIYD